MNRNRVLLGGLAAGVVWTAVDFIIHGGILAKTYEALQTAGVVTIPPGWFLPALIVSNLLVGCAIAYLYAAARATLGAGPGAALRIAVCVFIFLLPVLATQMAFYRLGADVNGWSAVGGILQVVTASLVAGWLYKD